LAAQSALVKCKSGFFHRIMRSTVPTPA
jgi:hypothetical protein